MNSLKSWTFLFCISVDYPNSLFSFPISTLLDPFLRVVEFFCLIRLAIGPSSMTSFTCTDGVYLSTRPSLLKAHVFQSMLMVECHLKNQLFCRLHSLYFESSSFYQIKIILIHPFDFSPFNVSISQLPNPLINLATTLIVL